MRIEKLGDLRAPGNVLLSISFQPHPVNEKWDLERVAVCGENKVAIWGFESNGNQRILSILESSTNSNVKCSRWSSDGRFLAVVDMEQITIYELNKDIEQDFNNNNDNNNMITSDSYIESWSVYTTFACNGVDECFDICWLSGSKILLNGTVSGYIIAYNIDEKSVIANLFVKDILEDGRRKSNIKTEDEVEEIGHVCGLNADCMGLFVSCQMTNRKLLVFEVIYNTDRINSKRNTKYRIFDLSLLIEEDRLLRNSPCILTYNRRPVFDSLTSILGCPYGEVGTSYFSCLFPFTGNSRNRNQTLGWSGSQKMRKEKSDIILIDEIEGAKDSFDFWSLNSKGKISNSNILQLCQPYRLRGHYRRVRICQFAPVVFTRNGELFTIFAQGCQDGSLSLWKVKYDCNPSPFIKGAECFLVLTNFIDEQASITEIAFDFTASVLLIGSDDNKVTYISFEFHEFALVDNKFLQDNCLDNQWNMWFFDYIAQQPKIPQVISDISTMKQSTNSKVISLPNITTNEIIEFQEKNQHIIINKGNKMRKIKPVNLTELQNDQKIINLGENMSLEQTNSELNMKKGEKYLEVKSNQNELSLINKSKEDVDLNILKSCTYNNNNNLHWIRNINIPQRLAIEFKDEIDSVSYMYAIFADNNQILNNVNRDSTRIEILCIRKSLEKYKIEEIKDDQNDILWSRSLPYGMVITNMIKMKHFVILIYSHYSMEYLNKVDNSYMEIINIYSGSILICDVILPYVINIGVCSVMDIIILIMSNGQMKIFRIPININESLGLGIDWKFEGYWGHLNESPLVKIECFIPEDFNLINNVKSDTNTKISKKITIDVPIILFFFSDGKVFLYSSIMANFIRLDDLEMYDSAFWSFLTPKPYFLSNSNSNEYKCTFTDEDGKTNFDLFCNDIHTDKYRPLRSLQRCSRLLKLRYENNTYQDQKGTFINQIFSFISKTPQNIWESTKTHIEHQLFCCLMLFSRGEFLYWFKLYIKYIVDTLSSTMLESVINSCLSVIKQIVSISSDNTQKDYISSFWRYYNILITINVDPIDLLFQEILPSLDNFSSYASKIQSSKYQNELLKFLDIISNIKDKVFSEVNTIRSKINNFNLESEDSIPKPQDSISKDHPRLEILRSIF
ncbi:hypothetical protein cand_028420 [Cryptosporidium andersoni]|uniref:Protein HIRA n=1 Tax=Cryptosporidium andersoni TaxID=117008 RepID=A0A1J4MUE4_9CRYT|nr:hypothetical protein cand_028420 [Cryptosporidium andersoni]